VKLVHGGQWRCAFGCARTFSTRLAFESHLVEQHQALFTLDELPALADACEKHVMPIADHMACPLCEQVVSEPYGRQRHIGKHFEALAIHVLEPPRHVGVMANEGSAELPKLQNESRVEDFEAKLAKLRQPESTGSKGTSISSKPTWASSSVFERPIGGSTMATSVSGSEAQYKKPTSAASIRHAAPQNQDVTDVSLTLEPSCAICGVPYADGAECPHEAEALQKALEQALQRWDGYQRTRYPNLSIKTNLSELTCSYPETSCWTMRNSTFAATLTT
jgi:hypothetical protein